MRCKVCGDVASGHHNDGDLSCPSCRIFFRRLALKRTIPTCPRDGHCEINLANRSHSCRYCRYQKCLRIGMKPHVVGGEGRIVREPTSLEATITEQIWTNNALSIVSKVRTTQKEVDLIATTLSANKTPGSPGGDMLHFFTTIRNNLGTAPLNFYLE